MYIYMYMYVYISNKRKFHMMSRIIWRNYLKSTLKIMYGFYLPPAGECIAYILIFCIFTKQVHSYR